LIKRSVTGQPDANSDASPCCYVWDP